MKHLPLAILLAVLSVGTCSADPLTAAELATHLGICHWKATVDLPHGSFSASLVEISDGKVTNTLISGLSGTSPDREVQKVVVMATTEASGTLLSLVVGNGSTNNKSHKEKPIILLGSCRSLNDKIKAGDYVLGGEYITRNGIRNSTGKVEDVKRGLLLRIVSNSVEPTK